MQNLDTLRYPIGKFNPPDEITMDYVSNCIKRIESFPSRLKAVVSALPEETLGQPYRPGGWTIRQLVHHVADSHMNSYIRFKWALTEDSPIIKAYDEKIWAELPEAKTAPVDVSIALLEALHRRWILLLNQLSEAEWQKQFIHPETNRAISLKRNVALYAWHGDHHLAHIEGALK